MPWQITKMNDVRREFVTKALQGGVSFAALCREYGVSRKTGYKWKQRVIADGMNGLAEHSRRPRRSPKQLDEAKTCALIRIKLRHPQWGPKKLCLVYARQHGAAPSVSSCHRVLQRAGLVQARPRRVKKPAARLQSAVSAREPNDVWTVDFKGWWRLGNGVRCEPLTIRDAFSRFLLAVRLPAGTNTSSVRTEFERVFQIYGLPRMIHSDNGSPFAGHNAPLGLSRLSAWWVSLGIELDRSRPAHPQDNGAHERMHRDVEVELAQKVQLDAIAQQAACDVWREEFNWERPHEALDGRCPGEVYRKSTRSLPKPSTPLNYGAGFFPRKIGCHGTLKWRQEMIFVSSALAGLTVGLKLAGTDQLEVWLNYLLVGTIDLQTSRFLGAPSRPEEPARLSA
jgi:transposase InsO family protein